MGHKQDLVIIGGGVGGLVTASVAGQLGLKVTLIEASGKLGGDCLHYGCIPSKTLIKSAAMRHAASQGPRFGVNTHAGDTDLAAVMARVREAIAHIQQHDDPDRFRGYGIDVRFGTAAFVDAHTVAVDGALIQGRRLVIATGSRPTLPPIPGLENVPYWTNERIFEQTTLPQRLAVIGGGPIGMELAQAFNRLGSAVTVLEAGAQILPKDNNALSNQLLSALRDEGIDIRTHTSVTKAQQHADHTTLTLAHHGDNTPLDVDAVLVATGRRPNLDALALENAGLALNAQGGLSVDRRLRTAQRHIFACGDCIGAYPFTHMAEYQASIIISNAVFRLPKRLNYETVPWVTYTDPELAQVGLTQAQAEQSGLKIQLVNFALADVDRAVADAATVGELRLVVHRGRILGASLLAPHAGEIIHELALAISARVPLRHLAGMIHAYPTLAQIIKRAAGSHYAPSLFSARTRTLVKWLNRLLP